MKSESIGETLVGEDAVDVRGSEDVPSNENAECRLLVSIILLLADIDMGPKKIKIGEDIIIPKIINIVANFVAARKSKVFLNFVVDKLIVI